MSGERVLVVDDEPEILRYLRPALTACDYEVLSVENGREALRAIAARAPDVVLLDLGLPDMDGKDVILQAAAFSKAPIIVLSARDVKPRRSWRLTPARRLCRKALRHRELMAACAPRCVTPRATRARSTLSSAADW